MRTRAFYKIIAGSSLLVFAVLLATFITAALPRKAAAYDPRPIYRVEWLNHGALRAYLHVNPTFSGINTTYVLRDTRPTGNSKIYAEPDAPTCVNGGVETPLTYIEVDSDTSMTQWYYNTDNTDASGNVNCTTSNLVSNVILASDISHPERRHQWFYMLDANTIYTYDKSVIFRKASSQPVSGSTIFLRDGDPASSCVDAVVNDGGTWYFFPMNVTGYNDTAYPPAANATSEDYEHYTNNLQAHSNCRVAPTEMVNVFHFGQAATKHSRDIPNGGFGSDLNPCPAIPNLPVYVGDWPLDWQIDPTINEFVFNCIQFNTGGELTLASHTNGLIDFDGADFAISGFDNSYKLVAGVSDVQPESTATSTDTGSDAGATEPPDWCNQSAGTSAWWLCGPVNFAADAAGKLDCQIINLLKIDTVSIFNAQGSPVTAPANCPSSVFGPSDPNSNTEKSSNAYYAAWGAFRNVAYAILVILGLIMVASQIMGLEIFDAYTIRKMLPKLIVAVIFLTLSWNIMQFLFTASNAAADAVMAIIEYPFRNINAANGATITNATLAWIIPTLLLVGGGIGAVTAVGLLGFGGVLALLASVLLFVFSAWVLLEARDVVATVLIIGSPLAIICGAYEPFEKLFSFWRGILVTILLSVPTVAAILAMTHAAALISLVSNNIVVALIIFIAGYGLLWAVFKQLDKVTGYFGNVLSQATGKAQGALSNYRKNTMQQRRQEAIEGRRNIPFGRTMRRMSLAGQAGNGGFFGRQNRARLAAAEQKLMQDSAKKRLEAEGGRMSGDDDAMALAMQRGMTRDRFIREYQAKTGRDGRRALADMEASFGAQVGTQSMRVAAARARWGSVSAYNDYDLSTREGANGMYQQMMQDAAEMVNDGQMSVTDVVAAMKANNQRADISGHSFPQMMAQVQASADRLRQARSGASNLQGRVLDEVTGEQATDASGRRLQQATGARVDQNGNAAASLISQSEIDAWQRGALEYAQPGWVAGRTEAVKVLGQHMKRRLDRTVAAQQRAEAEARANPNDAAAQQRLLSAEKETKRQVASFAGKYQVMAQISPENARIMAEEVSSQDIDMGAAGMVNIQQLTQRYATDPEYQQFRYEFYNSSMAGAQAQQAAQAQATATGQPPGQIPTPGAPGGP